MLAVLDGEALWNGKQARRQCLRRLPCDRSMKGVAARYPALRCEGKLVNLEQRINACRVEQQKAHAFAYESRDLLALTAYVGRQSRGMPIAVEMNETKAILDAGSDLLSPPGPAQPRLRAVPRRQLGQAARRQPIPQAHPTGYPIYRLEWQGMGSLQRRLRNCLIGIRAEPYAYGAPEFVELELYLMWRARGMKIETPAVRP